MRTKNSNFKIRAGTYKIHCDGNTDAALYNCYFMHFIIRRDVARTLKQIIYHCTYIVRNVVFEVLCIRRKYSKLIDYNILKESC